MRWLGWIRVRHLDEFKAETEKFERKFIDTITFLEQKNRALGTVVTQLTEKLEEFRQKEFETQRLYTLMLSNMKEPPVERTAK